MIQTKLVSAYTDSRRKRDIDKEVNKWLAENPEIQIMDIKFTTIQDQNPLLNVYLDSALIVYETGDE